MELLTITVSLVTIVVTIGIMSYGFRMVKGLKGGVLERGMKILAMSPIFLILSILTEILLANSEGPFDIVNDILLLLFVLCTFMGYSAIIDDWRRKMG